MAHGHGYPGSFGCSVPGCTAQGHKREPIVDQPPPIPNGHPAIAALVIEDMRERLRIGIERHGTPLQAFNGRDALVDAYQEALDLCQYLRQAIEERAGRAGADLDAYSGDGRVVDGK